MILFWSIILDEETEDDWSNKLTYIVHQDKEICMIVVRNTFQLKFGHAKEVKALIGEGREMMKHHGVDIPRYLMDVTGQFYTLEMESTYENLAVYEKSASETMSSKDFGAWYGKFMTHIESGHREIFSVVE